MPLGHLINLCQQYLTCVYRMGSRKCHLFKRHLTAQPKSGTAINEHSWVPVGRTRDRDKLMVLGYGMNSWYRAGIRCEIAVVQRLQAGTIILSESKYF